MSSCDGSIGCIWSTAGSRMLRGLLAAEAGQDIGRRHVKTLMRRMGIEALYRRPRTTTAEPGHKIYLYLLRRMDIMRPNQVWAMDITYIPMARGFVYLAVVLDWFSRRVLSWRLSITMEAASAWRRVRKPWLVTVSPRSSTRTRARSSRALSSSGECSGRLRGTIGRQFGSRAGAPLAPCWLSSLRAPPGYSVRSGGA